MSICFIVPCGTIRFKPYIICFQYIHRPPEKSDGRCNSIKKEGFLAEAEEPNPEEEALANYERFFHLVKQYTHIEELDQETVQTFIERIEIGPKLLPDGTEKIIHRNQEYRQTVRIFFKFIGELESEPVRDMPQAEII